MAELIAPPFIVAGNVSLAADYARKHNLAVFQYVPTGKAHETFRGMPRDGEVIVTTSGERRGDFADVSMCARIRNHALVRKTD